MPEFNSRHARLLTEQRNPASMDIDARSVAEILTIINQEDHRVAPAVAQEIPNIAQATELVIQALQAGGHLYYIGAGTSGRLGVLDASEIPPTFNAPPELVQGYIAGGDQALRRAIEGAEDYPEDGAKLVQELEVTAKDVVMGIATSGLTPFVLGAVQEAHRIGAKTIFLTCVDPAEIDVEVDVLISARVGPEVVAGSTRMKAGTATKLILNMISTTAMIKLGKVYENLMVDLRATNNKLTDRGRRIIASITGCTYEEAAELLEKAGKSVKVAIVMYKTGADAPAAERFLAQFHGNVRQAIAALEKEAMP